MNFKNNTPMVCIAILFCTSMAACKKQNNNTTQTELEKLPPITQTGANTFGCLVNGDAYLPNGRKPQNGGPNIVAYVDPTFQGGAFYITGHKYNTPDSYISFGSGMFTVRGIYSLSNGFNTSSYKKTNLGSLSCELSSNDNGTYKLGSFNITRYDRAGGIFSGTFEFTLFNANSSCGDTIKITNGRFDVKL